MDIWILNLLMLATIGFLLWVAFNYSSNHISSYAGLGLLITGIGIFMYQYNLLLILYKRADARASSASYLRTYKQILRKEYHISQKTIALYFVLLSCGIVLFMWEYIVNMPVSWAIAAYTLVAIWIAINWFIVRPKILKRREQKFLQSMKNLTELDHQLLEEIIMNDR